jgi:hypothetical protein
VVGLLLEAGVGLREVDAALAVACEGRHEAVIHRLLRAAEADGVHLAVGTLRRVAPWLSLTAQGAM